MAEIKVSSQQLKSVAQNLRGMNTQFKTEVQQLTSCQQKLNGMWDGEANTKFNSAYTRDKVKMDQFAKVIEQYIRSLEQIAANYQAAENKSTSIAGH